MASTTGTKRDRGARRPAGPVAWYGGKGLLTRWLRELVPTTAVYVEPYGGAASLLFAREPVGVEVYNDLDGRLVNLFRALQDPRRRRRLERRLRCTFYARADFVRAVEVLRSPAGDVDDDELAWAFFVGQNQSFGGRADSPGNWARSVKPGTSRPRMWWSRVEAIEAWATRLAGVQIECRDALEVIRFWDGPDATFYLDPPYVHATREAGSRNIYAVEPDEGHHQELVETLLAAAGACVVSGYDHPIYARLEQAGWERVARAVSCTMRGNPRSRPTVRRTEVVWRNARAVELAPRRRP
jgi:DNA adenine methylase